MLMTYVRGKPGVLIHIRTAAGGWAQPAVPCGHEVERERRSTFFAAAGGWGGWGWRRRWASGIPLVVQSKQPREGCVQETHAHGGTKQSTHVTP